MDGRLSVLGLYQYDQTLFDGMELPKTEFSMSYDDLYITPLPLEKDTLIFSLITELSQFSVVYPDPDFLKMAITAWSKKHVWEWQKLYESYFYKYNPLWNKDGKITNTDIETRNLKTTNAGGNTRTLNTTTKETFNKKETIEYGGIVNNVDHAENRSDRSVNAFNGGLELAERNEDTGDATNTQTNSGEDQTTENNSGSTLDTGTITDVNTENGTDTGTVKHEYDSYERGNIGVTMTQQLIEADRALYRNNIYDIIIRDFKKEFCILVY